MLHTINPEILFLKQEDVIKAGLLDMKQIFGRYGKDLRDARTEPHQEPAQDQHQHP